MTIVTLLTDFGHAEPYVGQVKGALLTIAPGATIVDLTHAVPPQDVATAAFLLATAVEAFPAGTIHVGVVDPGVGSPRRAIALATRRGDTLVGPDNGLLWPAVERLGGLLRAVELSERRYWRSAPTSGTFHGRDIFGPAAGHLAGGVSLAALGLPVAEAELTRYEVPRAVGEHGEVLYVDTYGNLVTSLVPRPDERIERVALRVGDHLAQGAPFYAAVAPGRLLVVVGSDGWLEIASRDGSAAAVTGARRGTRVSRERHAEGT